MGASYQRPTVCAGRDDTSSLLPSITVVLTMSITSTIAPLERPHVPASGSRWSSPPPPTALPTTMLRSGPVVALRELDTITPGGLLERLYVRNDLLVTAQDQAGHTWWIPAEAVWLDVDGPGHPEHPRSIGLATATSRERATVAGLSDRLGWEAVKAFERGDDLPPAIAVTEPVPSDVVVLDGRLAHDVPTVVVMGADFVRWAAGSTWDGAVRRALYGDDGNPNLAAELSQMVDLLAVRSLGIVAVDLDTPLLRRAGIVRCSVQLVASNGSGRAWYAPTVD